MTKSARKKTNYKNIYYNEGTKKYDVKYNYKEYDPILQKNKYKSQWVYNCMSIAEAKEALAKSDGGVRTAIVMILLGCGKEEAENALKTVNGQIQNLVKGEQK